MRTALGQRQGYLAAFLGTLLGTIFGAVAGGFLSTLYADLLLAPEQKINQIIQFLRTIAAGLWVGGVVGCWLALRARRHSARSTTAVLQALLTLPTVGYFWYSLPAYGVNPPSLVVAAVITVLILPMLSRFVALRLRHILRGK